MESNDDGHVPGKLLDTALDALNPLGLVADYQPDSIGCSHAPLILAYGEEGNPATLAQVSIGAVSLLNSDPEVAAALHDMCESWTGAIAFGELTLDSTFLELFQSPKNPGLEDQAELLRFLDRAMLDLDVQGSFIITWGTGFKLQRAKDASAVGVGFVLTVPISEQTWTRMMHTKQLELRAATLLESHMTAKQLKSETPLH